MADPRPADKLAGKDSLADRLRRRREAIEAGDASGGDAFQEKPEWKDLPVDSATGNRKTTIDEEEVYRPYQGK